MLTPLLQLRFILSNLAGAETSAHWVMMRREPLGQRTISEVFWELRKLNCSTLILSRPSSYNLST